MSNFDLQAIAQFVAIVGGIIGLVLALLQIADTWLDLRTKLKRKGKKKEKSHQPFVQ